MAMYHFRIKSDKRANGSTINAVSHAKYINREDEYINIDSKQELSNQKFSNNIISGNKINQDVDSMKLLYKSPLGSIIGNHDAICLSDKPSPATVDIGIMYAFKNNDGPLHVSGTSEFKFQVILCAADLNLKIRFDDPNMQNEFETLKKDYNKPVNKKSNARGESELGFPNFDRTFTGLLGENEFDKILGDKPTFDIDECDELFRGDLNSTTEGRNEEDNLYEWDSELFAPELSPSDFEAMHNTQDSDADEQESEITQLDVTETESDHPEEKRNISITRINRAEKITMDIMLASTGMTKGADHVAYINREERFSSRGGCIYTNHHLPSWAKDAKDFFEEADEKERINGSRYKEIEFALPNELNLEQQKEIIDIFIDHHLKDFYYAYAVHEKIGALSNGQEHPHVHIMFSERKMDAYEKEHERERGLFFKTVARKDPATGGCAKDPKFNGKNRMLYLRYMRQDFGNIQNNILAKYGYNIQVDHRTLEAQRKDALNRGDVKLAELLNRMPEKSVGPIAAKDPQNKKVIHLAMHRKLKEELALNTYCRTILEGRKLSITSFNAIIKLDKTIKAIKESKEVLDHGIYSYDKMLNVVISRRNNMAKIFERSTFPDEAIRNAISRRMSISDAEKYNRMTELTAQRKSLKDFIATYPAPDKDDDNYRVYAVIKSSIESQAHDYTKEITALAKELKPTFIRLQEQTNQKLIHDDVQKALSKESKYQKQLEKLTKEADMYCKKINRIITDEQERITAEEIMKEANTPPPEYTSSQLLEYTIANQRIIWDRMKEIEEKLKEAAKDNISESAARNMAISIYTGKESKKVNAEGRELKKGKEQLLGARQELKDNASWANDPEHKDEYEKMQHIYNERITNYEERLSRYEIAKKALNIKCNTPEAKERINEITIKILNKNVLNNKHYESLKAELGTLKSQHKNYKTQIQGLRKQVALDKQIQRAINKAPRYSLSSSTPVPPGKRKSYTPSILSGVLGSDEHMANLRAYVKIDSNTAKFLASGKTEADIEMEMDEY